MRRLALLAIVVISPCFASAQHRPPAVPLVVNDPTFSIWSMATKLTDQPTKHWSEAPQPLTGLIRIDGVTLRWMGVMPRQYFGMPEVDPMPQDSVEVTPLHSRYVFSARGVRLHVTFFTPLLPRNLDVMSRPVTYLTWRVEATDGKDHNVDVLIDADPQVAVNDPAEQVTWSRTRLKSLTSLNVGTRDQEVLNRSGDRIRQDWGYFHLVLPDSESAATALSFDGMAQFAKDGTLPDTDDMDMPKSALWRGHPAHLVAVVPFGKVSDKSVEKHVLLAYTSTYSIEYLGRKLRDYWQRNGMTETQLLITAEREYPQLEGEGERFDHETMRTMERVGGPDYAYLTALAFRQTIAAHKLVADVDGQPYFFSKENDSNGCIDTVDVTYPSAPFFLYYNPALLEAQLEPLMRYAALPRWRFPFAPHDLGTFPLADGQVYGGGEQTEDNQMPVEESGNLLILIDALGRAEHNFDFARTYMPQLTRWAEYLAEKGLDPDNQLSTDDFSGHLAHNTNLSIKAILALEAFSDIAKRTGDAALSKKYEDIAKALPAKWETMAIDGDHYKLAFDQPGTWSQKYNLVWDEMLNFNIFPKHIAATEWAFYTAHMEPYGLPLDDRQTITKLDWQVWTGLLTEDPKQFRDLLHQLVVWTDETKSRVPLTDYYDSVTGLQKGFQARSVVGGVFIKALSVQGNLK